MNEIKQRFRERFLLPESPAKNSQEYNIVDKLKGKVRYYEQFLVKHTHVSWNDIIPKIQAEHLVGSLRILNPKEGSHIRVNRDDKMVDEENSRETKPYLSTTIPSLITRQMDYCNDTLMKAILEADDAFGINILHLYISFVKDCSLFDMHADTHSVLLVGALGEVEYEITYNTDTNHKATYLLKPGDGLYIPKGVYHKPRVFGPRITFSYKWNYIY